jgi:two-component system chemotaxis response regulator CheB
MSVQPEPVRVLIVDDSATVRSLVRRLLHRDPALEVVGEAGDGARAVELVGSLRPDVVVMDIEMPVLDGLAAIERIMASRPTPVLILSARAPQGRDNPAFEAIRYGAVEVAAKPSSPEGWQQLAGALARMVRDLAEARRSPRAPVVPPGAAAGPRRSRDLRFIAIGASTGGPEATLRLLASLPVPAPAAILVVQHIAEGFEEGLASWLASRLGCDVRVARNGDAAIPGVVRLAPPGSHLLLEKNETIRLDTTTPPWAGHRPSANELFLSCARTYPRATAGIVLTGMGSDGAEGLNELRKQGGLTLAQDHDSSVVYGMPRMAAALGAVEIALPPEQLGALLRAHFSGSAR